MIDSMLKLTEEINNLLNSSGNIEIKEDLLHKIKYAEKSIVFFKKKIFKNLYFSESQFLANEIEKNLINISQTYEYSNTFDRKNFKQLQNILWVLQKKLNEDQKKHLQKLIDNLKGINIKSRSRRFMSYYENQNYYNTNNNYYNTNTNNFYPYSNYTNPSMGHNRRSDYYEPYYKKVDLIELPDITHNKENSESYLQENQNKYFTQDYAEDSNNYSENNNKNLENYDFNQEEKFGREKIQYKEADKITKNYFKKDVYGMEQSYNNDQDNYLNYENEDKLDKALSYNVREIKDETNFDKNRDFLKNENKEVNINNEQEKIENFHIGKSEPKNLNKNSFNKDHIETVFVSSTNHKDYKSHKNYCSYSIPSNAKNNKKRKDSINTNFYPNPKSEKDENKNTAKKSKKNKSNSHILVEVDLSKNEKEINNNITNVSEKILDSEKDLKSPKQKQKYENNYFIEENKNHNTNEEPSEEIKDFERAKDEFNKLEKDNIEVIRHYQSDYGYGKYNYKYQKNYHYNYKQTSSSKNNKIGSNYKLSEGIISPEVKTENIKNEISSNKNQIKNETDIPNFTSTTNQTNIDKENNATNISTVNNNPIISNNKYRNKSYNTYNSYNYNNYNNNYRTPPNLQEKEYAEKEPNASENEKKPKYLIKEVEFSDNNNKYYQNNLSNNSQSIQMQINNFINSENKPKEIDDKDNQNIKENYKIFSSIMLNTESLGMDHQLVKSHSDLENNLNDLKMMDLNVDITDFAKNNNDPEQNLKEINNNKTTRDISYETVTTYINDSSRYNFNNTNYKGIQKSKIGKHTKYYQHIRETTPVKTDETNDLEDKYLKNNYVYSKQNFSNNRETTNNYCGKTYSNNNIENNNYYNYKNISNMNTFYDKANYNTGKKKSYANNYKVEKIYDTALVQSNNDENFNKKNSENTFIENILNEENANKETQKDSAKSNGFEEEKKFIKEDNLNNKASNEVKNSENENENGNSESYSKGHLINFNSINTFDIKENVNNKNYFENNSKNYNNKELISNKNSNNNNVVINKNNSYIKQQQNANNINIYINEIENSNEHVQDNINNRNANNFIQSNFGENKSKNKKHIKTYESNYYDSSKSSFDHNKVNQNQINYYNNSNNDYEESNKIRAKEDLNDFNNYQMNKLKNKKGKNSKTNNINIRNSLNSNIRHNNNYINYEHYNASMNINPNLNQNKFLNQNNINQTSNPNFNNANNFVINQGFNNNIFNENNQQNQNNNKPLINYKYNSTDIGLFNNLLGTNIKQNQTQNNYNMPMNINSNFNMVNYGLLNYMNQVNLFNQMNTSNYNPKLNPIKKDIRHNSDSELLNINKSPSKILEEITEINDNKDNKYIKENKENEILVNKESPSEKKIIKQKEELDLPELNNDKCVNLVEDNKNKDKSEENKISNNQNQIEDLKVISLKDNKPIGIFNMDIEKFFQSDTKDLNLENISHMQKNNQKEKNYVVSMNNPLSELTDLNIKNQIQPTEDNNSNKTNLIEKPKENFDLLINKKENLSIKNSEIPKYDFTSENDTEKDLNNNNTEEENDSDDDSSSDSDSIPNEEIEAAFQTFQNEIKQMHSIPIPMEEEDDDYYVGESDYVEENKNQITKNNKAIFEEDLNENLENSVTKKEISCKIPSDKINLKKINDIEDDSEDEDEEEEISDSELYAGNKLVNNINLLEKEKIEIISNVKTIDNDSSNTNQYFNKIPNENNIHLNRQKPTNVINNQIYNNINFFNMQMIPNPNMLNYLNTLNIQNSGNKIMNNQNMMKMIENGKIMNMNFAMGKNIKNNLMINQNNLNNNIYFANQQLPKNLREQTKSYTDSIKTIDPDLLKIIKNKLTENTNIQPNRDITNDIIERIPIAEDEKEIDTLKSENDTNTRKNSIIDNSENTYNNKKFSEKKSSLDGNDQRKNSMNENQLNVTENTQGVNIINNDLQNANFNANLQNYLNNMNNGKAVNIKNLNKNTQFQNYIMNNWANFIFRGRDSNIHREYLTLKYLEQENPFLISKNIEGFENRILIPIYQKLIFNVNKRKGVYFFTFNRYRKIICKVLQNSKILKKVKPYGSLMNNFMIDSGDIDICIVPNCGILDFATYLDKIKEELISQVN